jgi:hypothetical protein
VTTVPSALTWDIAPAAVDSAEAAAVPRAAPYNAGPYAEHWFEKRLTG